MRDYETPRTKLSIVLTAGELFSEKGLDGVTVREIADKAGVNLGSIHYHFQSKEALYIETFRYTTEKVKSIFIKEFVEKDLSLLQTPEGIAKLIWKCVDYFLHNVLLKNEFEWENRLIFREMINVSPILSDIVEEVFRPDHENYLTLYRYAKPNGDNDDAHIWSLFLPSQAVLYNLCSFGINKLVGKNVFNEEFVRKLSRFTAKMMIAGLDLPIPDELKN